MVRHDSESTMSKSRRVPRACDHCRLRKTKCDKLRPCTRCTQNEIRCTVQPKRLRSVKLQESNDTLTKAVHALYGICKPDTVVTNTEVTTETILERLGLSEYTSSGEGSVFTHQNMECTTGLRKSMWTGPEPSTCGSDVESNTAHIDLAYAPESLSSATHSSPCSDQYQSSIATNSKPTSLSTEGSRESVAASPSPDRIEAAMPSLACQQEIALLYSPGFADIDSVIYNDFDVCLWPMAGKIPVGPLPAIEDEFCFDRPMRLLEPGARDWVPLSSTCANIESDIKHCDFQRFCASPPLLTTAAESARSVINGACKYSPIRNPQDAEQLTQASAIPSTLNTPIPSTSKTPIQSTRNPSTPPRRPGRPRQNSQMLQDNPFGAADKRRMSLEKNRLAASKCREKRKAEVDALKDASAAVKAENSLLKQHATKLREEILCLREELLAHVFRCECSEQEKWRAALGAIWSEVTSAS